MFYNHAEELPPVNIDDVSGIPPVTVHLAALGFSNDCSLKPPAGKALFMQLCEQYVMDLVILKWFRACPSSLYINLAKILLSFEYLYRETCSVNVVCKYNCQLTLVGRTLNF